MLLLDGQVHHDTHVIPMGNYVIGVGNYVIVSPSDLGNYVSADKYEAALIRERTLAGLQAARARGRTGGRKPKMTPALTGRPSGCMTPGSLLWPRSPPPAASPR